VRLDVIDRFEKVTDKDAAIMTRRIAREEGIFAGNSAGSAIAGLLQLKDNFGRDDVVVVIFHDHGSRYLGKMFNDDWMREKGFLEKTGMTARDLVAAKLSGELCAIEAKGDTRKPMATIEWRLSFIQYFGVGRSDSGSAGGYSDFRYWTKSAFSAGVSFRSKCWL